MLQWNSPSPGQIVREDTAKQRANNRCNSIDSPEHASIRCRLARRNGKGDDGVATRADARTSSAGNCAPDDQGRAALRNGTDETTEFEDADGYEERCLEREVLVCFAPSCLERGHGKEESRAIPADLVERVEFVSDAGNCRSDDGLVVQQLVVVSWGRFLGG
jgi:hypothetical protein